MRRMDHQSKTSVSAPAVVQQPKLLDRLREKVRVKHYSIRTEQVYVDWARRFILFHGKRHPAQMGAAEKPVSPHILRHWFATHMLQAGYDIGTARELLGYADLNITMIYTHVLNRDGKGVVSPLDQL